MRIIIRLLAAVTLIGILARLLPVGLSALPWLPVIVSATPWFALTGLLALVLSLLPFSREHAGRLAVIALMVVCLAFEAVWQLPYVSGASAKAAGTTASTTSGDTVLPGQAYASTTLRVMTCNVYKGNADAERIVELVRSEGVQVLALQETTTAFVDQLEAAGLNELLPYSVRSSSDGVFGNGVWSVAPLGDEASDDIGSSASAMPAGTISVRGTDADGSQVSAAVRFVSVHTTAPVSGYWDLWRKSVEEIGIVRERIAADPSTRYVLMGDFNATYDHAPFREMLGDTLRDAARSAGEGLTLTWPTNRRVLPPFCGIDHVVMGPGVSASDLRTVDVPGTDHAALLCTLTITGA